MLFKKQRCPYTGVVNLFSDVDPWIAVGSIVQTGHAMYVWRSHVDGDIHGIARFLPVAEAHLCRALGARGAAQTARSVASSQAQAA